MSKKNYSKKEQFTQPQKSKLPLIAASAVVILALVLVIKLIAPGDQDKTVYFGDPIAQSRSYIGQVVSMTVVEPVIEEGRIKIPLAEVDENNIISFEIENDQGTLVPLMAYITPSGRLFAGSSMCEPCRGRTFSLAGETLLCDTCRTTYSIEDHQFLAGAPACGSYPPVNMNPALEDGMMVIELEEVLNWRIRT